MSGSPYRNDGAARAKRIVLRPRVQTYFVSGVVFVFIASAFVAFATSFLSARAGAFGEVIAIVVGVVAAAVVTARVRPRREIDVRVEQREVVVERRVAVPLERIAGVDVRDLRRSAGYLSGRRGDIVLRMSDGEIVVVTTPARVYADCVVEAKRLRAFLTANGWSGEAT